jgi:hypothetical protein
MKLDLENLNPGAWFDLPGGGRICLRVLSIDEANSIEKATVRRRPEYKDGRRFEVETSDTEKQFDMTWRACIVDWDGITDAKDAAIECTDEMKVALMRKSPDFARAVIGLLNRMKQADADAAEAAEKN